GEKTALKLLAEYGTVENVLENIEGIGGKKLKANLTDHREEALMSKELATIHREVPFDFTLEDLAFSDDSEERKYELFKELEFESLLGSMEANEDEDKIVFDDVCEGTNDEMGDEISLIHDIT